MGRNAAAHVVLALLKIYKTVVSPLFAGSCRYLPSCSDYMAEAATWADGMATVDIESMDC